MRAWLFRPQIPYQSHSYETATNPHTTLTERSRSNYFSRALLSADCFMASPYHTKPKPLAFVMRTQCGKYSPFLVGKPQGRSSGELSVSRDARWDGGMLWPNCVGDRFTNPRGHITPGPKS